MIKNERQYRITKSQLARFEALADELTQATNGSELSNLEVAAANAQVKELRAALEEYDRLRSGQEEVGPLTSLADLPRHLLRARIAAGLTQRDLADRLGIAEQQVQRYEAADWSTASLDRLIEVANALDINDLSDAANIRVTPTPAALTRNLRAAGLDAAFVNRRIAPPGVHDSLEEPGSILDFAARVHRIYGWSPSAVLEGSDLAVTLPEAVGFKIPTRAADLKVRAYTVYAHYLSVLALAATEHLQQREIPDTANDFRTAVLERSGSLDFLSILEFVWSLGIPVIPLADPGGFHGVVFRDSGRNVIVLKQQHRSNSRWVFDLLHEVRHATEEPEAASYVAIDVDEEDNGLEVTANLFAGDVLLDGRAEELAQECVTEAGGRLEFLKNALPKVARRNKVSVADLANYMAYRLSLQGENWWGAATNLQRNGDDPWRVVRDLFFSKADLTHLTPLDRNLLIQAMTNDDS